MARMKMKPEHYRFLEEEINASGFNNERTKARYRNAGLSMMRFRWDLTYYRHLSTWICDNLYPYLNDNHIDTALRKITGTT